MLPLSSPTLIDCITYPSKIFLLEKDLYILFPFNISSIILFKLSLNLLFLHCLLIISNATTIDIPALDKILN